MQGSGFRVQGAGCRVQCWENAEVRPSEASKTMGPLNLGLKSEHLEGAGLRVQGAGFRVQGSGFRVQGARFRVQCWENAEVRPSEGSKTMASLNSRLECENLEGPGLRVNGSSFRVQGSGSNSTHMPKAGSRQAPTSPQR